MHVAQSLATLRLDPAASAPMFRQLYQGIRGAILAGGLPPGTRLPPTRELAVLVGVSRQTVLNAYEQLTAEGYLAGTVGRGTFVSEHLPAGRPNTARNPDKPLRPLSARGQAFVGPRASLTYHDCAHRVFRTGMPGLDVFPFAIWAKLEARHWRRRECEFGYGDPAGYRPLREAVATYLSTSRGVHCAPEQVLITSGSQQALYLIATLLLAPQDSAWVEEPGYRGINASLRAAQARICPVPVDDEGLVVAHGARRFPDAKLVYVTPSHQYPLGVTMSLARRLELLAWAAHNKMWVVEDDYDSEYRYTGPPLASLQSLDKAGCVLYVGTLSKVLFPGLRLGYLVLPPALVEAFTQAKAVIDRHSAIVPQATLADFITGGHFARHIKRSREAYAERRAVLLDELDRHFAAQLDVRSADAGLHLLARFRDKRDDVAVLQAGRAHGIELRVLSQFYNESSRAPETGLLLGFAPHPPEEIRRGIAVLRKIL
ncbi:PLP-dependent aminotransferase family protein [Oxalobacteraceae bacterium OM1]|nr:PLP-dependent aminotransferase family protein [Oxalobacteraceae bacterium OM1]